MQYTERVRERTQREPKTHSNTQRVRERTHYFDLATDIDLPHASDAKFSQTITAQTNARSRPMPEPAHTDLDQRPIQLSQSITGPATPITEPNTDSR